MLASTAEHSLVTDVVKARAVLTNFVLLVFTVEVEMASTVSTMGLVVVRIL